MASDETNTLGNIPTVESYLKRISLFLEDGNWRDADKYCEKILDIDPENADAYLGKLLAELKLKKKEELKDCAVPFDGSKNYQKVIRFGDNALQSDLVAYIKHINIRNENARQDGIYEIAIAKMNRANISGYRAAIQLFQSIPGWRDTNEKIVVCREKIQELKEKAGHKIKSAIKLALWLAGIFAFILVITQVVSPLLQYHEAISLMEAGRDEAMDIFSELDGYRDSERQINRCILGKIEVEAEKERSTSYGLALYYIGMDPEEARSIFAYSAAVDILVGLPGYKESNKYLLEASFLCIEDLLAYGKYTEIIDFLTEMQTWISDFNTVREQIYEDVYQKALSNKNSGKYSEAYFLLAGIGEYKNAFLLKQELLNERIGSRNLISAGDFHTVAVAADGTVLAAGGTSEYGSAGQCDVSEWTEIVSVATGDYHTVGLKADGTVVAVGRNMEGQCNVNDWSDIVQIEANYKHTVGLKNNGTVVATGNNEYGQCNVSQWSDIVAISVGNSHTVGLKADGTVVAAGLDLHGRTDVENWTDIVAISAGDHETYGLREDGTVIAVGNNRHGECEVSDWTDIVAVRGGGSFVVGIKRDGTVVATGYDEYGQCRLSDWADIVAVAPGGRHTIGLKSDGTLIASVYDPDSVGFYPNEGQCDVLEWDILYVS